MCAAGSNVNRRRYDWIRTHRHAQARTHAPCEHVDEARAGLLLVARAGGRILARRALGGRSGRGRGAWLAALDALLYHQRLQRRDVIQHSRGHARQLVEPRVQLLLRPARAVVSAGTPHALLRRAALQRLHSRRRGAGAREAHHGRPSERAQMVKVGGVGSSAIPFAHLRVHGFFSSPFSSARTGRNSRSLPRKSCPQLR